MPTYIDKDKLMNEFIEFVAPSNRDSSLPIPTWNDAVSLLGSAPDADVEAVVRCKDCKYANKERLPQGSKWFASCDHFNTHSVMADDYCSYAERKEAEE